MKEGENGVEYRKKSGSGLRGILVQIFDAVREPPGLEAKQSGDNIEVSCGIASQ